MVKYSLKILFIILLPVLFYSCNNSNPTEVNSIINIDLTPPLITGIVRTGPDGPMPIAVYGTPNEMPQLSSNNTSVNSSGGVSTLPRIYQMSSPYPNPCDGSIVVQYSIPVKTNVLMWIIKGRLPGENVSGSVNYANGNFVAPFTNYFKILDEGDKSAGAYKFNWSATDQKGKILPDGVYRVYIEVNGQLMWRNIWLYRNVRDNYNPF